MEDRAGHGSTEEQTRQRKPGTALKTAASTRSPVSGPDERPTITFKHDSRPHNGTVSRNRRTPTGGARESGGKEYSAQNGSQGVKHYAGRGGTSQTSGLQSRSVSGATAEGLSLHTPLKTRPREKIFDNEEYKARILRDIKARWGETFAEGLAWPNPPGKCFLEDVLRIIRNDKVLLDEFRSGIMEIYHERTAEKMSQTTEWWKYISRMDIREFLRRRNTGNGEEAQIYEGQPNFTDDPAQPGTKQPSNVNNGERSYQTEYGSEMRRAESRGVRHLSKPQMARTYGKSVIEEGLSFPRYQVGGPSDKTMTQTPMEVEEQPTMDVNRRHQELEKYLDHSIAHSSAQQFSTYRQHFVQTAPPATHLSERLPQETVKVYAAGKVIDEPLGSDGAQYLLPKSPRQLPHNNQPGPFGHTAELALPTSSLSLIQNTPTTHYPLPKCYTCDNVTSANWYPVKARHGYVILQTSSDTTGYTAEYQCRQCFQLGVTKVSIPRSDDHMRGHTNEWYDSVNAEGVALSADEQRLSSKSAAPTSTQLASGYQTYANAVSPRQLSSIIGLGNPSHPQPRLPRIFHDSRFWSMHNPLDHTEPRAPSLYPFASSQIHSQIYNNNTLDHSQQSRLEGIQNFGTGPEDRPDPETFEFREFLEEKRKNNVYIGRDADSRSAAIDEFLTAQRNKDHTVRTSQPNIRTGQPAQPQLLASKGMTARKRQFVEVIDLTDDGDESISMPPAKRMNSNSGPETFTLPISLQQSTSFSTTTTSTHPRHPQPQNSNLQNIPYSSDLSSRHPYPKVLVDSIETTIESRPELCRLREYDSTTIAHDVLLAIGKHPSGRKLNGHLDILQGRFGVNRYSDLETFDWALARVQSLHQQKRIMPPPLEAPKQIRPTRESIRPPKHSYTPILPPVQMMGPSSHTPYNPSSLRNATAPGFNSPSKLAVVIKSHTPSSKDVIASPSTTTATSNRRGQFTKNFPPGHIPQSSNILTASGKKRGRPFTKNVPPGHEPPISPKDSINSTKRDQPFKDSESKSEDPSPVEGRYAPFICEWKDCPAELQNLDTLRAHIFANHEVEADSGSISCLWAKCNNGTEIPERYQFKDLLNWRSHIEERHLKNVAWHMGDGPRGTSLDTEGYDSGASRHSYLIDKNGRQVTPSLAKQKIEPGRAKENNEKRFIKTREGIFSVLEKKKSTYSTMAEPED
ncbi:hypothetical protein BP5796_08146 [Coleophoma crateriformis]|uniref:C2H2-type domain-containing protein n=1 Tax=Coleophoma crateriformis TaxID=565419 RepID=A0A3D8RDL0_9HELO|nr:hypothetical protein BP5796_08146 [Coleophoma crateriformis]